MIELPTRAGPHCAGGGDFVGATESADDGLGSTGRQHRMHFAPGEIAEVTDGRVQRTAEWKRRVALSSVAVDQDTGCERVIGRLTAVEWDCKTAARRSRTLGIAK